MKSRSLFLVVVFVTGCGQEAEFKSSSDQSSVAREIGAATPNPNPSTANNAKPFSISVTDMAAEKFRAALIENPKMTHVSVAVEFNKGCVGFIYNLGMVSNPSESKSLLLESNGVRLAIDKKSAEFLMGTTLDFATLKSGAAGFVFRNPNEDKSLPDELK